MTPLTEPEHFSGPGQHEPSPRARQDLWAARRPPYSAARRVVFWIVVAAAGVVLVMSAIATFPSDPQEGEGWIGGPIQAIFAGGPLVAVAIGLRSHRQSIAKRTAVASLLLALLVTFVLVMQLLDPNETTSDRLVQGLAALVYLTAFAVELPAFKGQWPPHDSVL